MKKGIIAVIALLLVLTIYLNRVPLATLAYNTLYQSPCNTPTSYAIGRIDPTFTITKNEFQNDIEQAANVWSTVWSKPLFVYDQEGEITINLISDGRQSLNTKVNQLSNQVDQEKNSLDPQIASYQQQVTSFEQKLSEFNNRVDYWNNQGGAPPEAYQELKDQQEELRRENQRLKQLGASLNQSTNQFNTQVNDLNQAIGTFNQALSYKPEEGEYIVDNGKRTINIYFNTSDQELVHTLAHELGHALTLPHNANEISIMYPQTNQVIRPSIEDIDALTIACQKVNVIVREGEKLSLTLARFKAGFLNSAKE